MKKKKGGENTRGDGKQKESLILDVVSNKATVRDRMGEKF